MPNPSLTSCDYCGDPAELVVLPYTDPFGGLVQSSPRCAACLDTDRPIRLISPESGVLAYCPVDARVILSYRTWGDCENTHDIMDALRRHVVESGAYGARLEDLAGGFYGLTWPGAGDCMIFPDDPSAGGCWSLFRLDGDGGSDYIRTFASADDVALFIRNA